MSWRFYHAKRRSAPFSFFAVCDEPPVVMLSVSKKEDGGKLTAESFPPEVSEFWLAGGRRRRPQWAGWALASARWLR